MIYPEHIRTQRARNGAWLRWMELMAEREELFQMTQPGAIRYDTVKVISSVDGSTIETYMAEISRRHLDERITEAKRLYDEWELALKEATSRLELSKELDDEIYYLSVVRRWKVSRIARHLHYSERWIRAKLARIRKTAI